MRDIARLALTIVSRDFAARLRKLEQGIGISKIRQSANPR